MESRQCEKDRTRCLKLRGLKLAVFSSSFIKDENECFRFSRSILALPASVLWSGRSVYQVFAEWSEDGLDDVGSKVGRTNSCTNRQSLEKDNPLRGDSRNMDEKNKEEAELMVEIKAASNGLGIDTGYINGAICWGREGEGAR